MYSQDIANTQTSINGVSETLTLYGSLLQHLFNFRSLNTYKNFYCMHSGNSELRDYILDAFITHSVNADAMF